MSIKSGYEEPLIMVPKEYYYQWYQMGVKRPSAWIKIEVNKKVITGGRKPDDYGKDFSAFKDFNPLISPFYINCKTATDNHGFFATSNNNYSYVYTPSIVGFLIMNSPNLSNGFMEIINRQQGQKKPEIIITFQEVDAPNEGTVTVLSEFFCTTCEVVGFQIREEMMHLKFHYGAVVYKDVKNDGNIVANIENMASPKGAK